MRTASRIVAAAAAVLMAVPARGGSATAPAAADPASPGGVVVAFVKALDENDATALATLATGDAPEREWVRAEAAQLRAMADLERAVAKRFGPKYDDEEDGRNIKEQIEQMRDVDLRDGLKAAKVEPAKGDVATIVLDESAPDDRQGRLVRAGGRWAVDLASLSEYWSPDDVPVMAAVANAAAALSADVAAGRFATLADAAAAIDAKLTAAQDEGLAKAKLPAATQPAGAKG